MDRAFFGCSWAKNTLIASFQVRTISTSLVSQLKSSSGVAVPAQLKNETSSDVFFLVVPREHMNCFMCVGTRKAELCFSSKKNE